MNFMVGPTMSTRSNWKFELPLITTKGTDVVSMLSRRGTVSKGANRVTEVNAKRDEDGLPAQKLAKIVQENRFVETLLSLQGSIPPDIDLEF